LQALAQHPSALVREHVAWALGEGGGAGHTDPQARL